MRQLAELLSDKGVASLRYDKIGTGKTGLGPYAQRPADVGSSVYTTGAKAAVSYLAEQSATEASRISVYAVGEGTIHAMALATDTNVGAPKIHSLGLFQPLPGRYLDIITDRVRASAGPEALNNWLAAVDQVRTKGTVAPNLPEGLGALLNPGNVKAVIEADKIDPLIAGRQGARGHARTADVFRRRQTGHVRVGQAARRRAQAHRPDRGRSQGRQPCAARRSDGQRRQLLQAGSAFSTARQCARRVCRQVDLIWRHE